MPNRTWLSAKDFQRSKLVSKRKELPPPSPVRHIIKDGKVLEPKTLRRILAAAETQAKQISGDAPTISKRKRRAEFHYLVLRASVRLMNLSQGLTAPTGSRGLPWRDDGE